MSYYTESSRKAAVLCLSASLAEAEEFTKNIDRERLSRDEYIAVLAAATTRIAGCASYEPADAMAAASRITENVLSEYDPASGDQTLDSMGLLTRYMRYVPKHFKTGEGRDTMLSILGIWLGTWAKVENQIDPGWSPKDTFRPFEAEGVMDGQTPDTITDPDIRAAYEEHLEAKRIFMKRNRDQSLFRRALERYRTSYLDYVAELSKDPTVSEALPQLANRVADRAIASALGRASQ